MFSRSTARSRFALVAAVSAAVVVGSVAVGNWAAAAPAGGGATPGLAAGVPIARNSLAGSANPAGKLPMGLPPGVPAKGRYAFLLRLATQPTSLVFNQVKSARGIASARSAASSQLRAVQSAQSQVISALPSDSQVLYRMHALMAGVAVTTDVRNYAKLRSIGNVAAVYPIAPKTTSNSYAVPLQKATQVWQSTGDLGANATVAVIDTGVDYTHANFGGPGTTAAYKTALANDTKPVSTGGLDGSKFDLTTKDAHGHLVGFWDFAGDKYDPSSPDAKIATPHPDPNPLDCDGHGSHVAGIAAGYGENTDGSTFTGDYTALGAKTPSDYQSMFRIGPGMAPKARLYAYRVFGCAGSTDLVSEAIDKAMDPNGDLNPADHVDVINMSIGSDYASPQDGDSVAANLAVQAGITVVAAAGNAGDIYDVAGSPGSATQVIAAAASADSYSQVDAMQYSIDGSAQTPAGAERSAAYDWATKPDLGAVAGIDANKVAMLAPGSTNLDACDPLDKADAAAVQGKIAFVEWTDDDVTRRCGSAARAANIANAGATGFIYADDQETFSAAITGSDTIPGVIVTKSAGDAIRSALLASKTVTVSGTTANGFGQLVPGMDDTVAGFSSRGIGDNGNVKPDVTAVGQTVFSTGMGTGNQGLNDSGTSMASPMVAGEAALIASLHKASPSAQANWTPEQIKADIMNTADQDVFTGLN
ncbi:MAG TPA: S8 family serine peptidase, partial [Jatrophihabitans sp.]|nr:S8 family serine peptidase [Jatrophihabitans sp.]